MSRSESSQGHSNNSPQGVFSTTALPDDRTLRTALGCFATGVTVVTAIAPNGKPIGLTVNSFASVSLDPPLILWSLAHIASDFEAFRQASYYCVNILSEAQTDISNRFASKVDDRFAGIDWQPGLAGSPVLANCVASLQVLNEVQYPGGDHLIFVGRVEQFAYNSDIDPLLFQGGRYGTLRRQ